MPDLTTIAVGGGGVAAIALPYLWPLVSSLPAWWSKSDQKVAVTYAGAIDALAVVRSRLLTTKQLSDDQKHAIDVLTLALVAGSDE
jgi:hypothetical protein